MGNHQAERVGQTATGERRKWRVGLYLAGAQPDVHEARAREFCSRGTTVDLVSIPVDTPAPAGLDARFHLHPSTVPEQATTGTPDLRVTDATGASLDDSLAVATAVRRGAPAVEVQVRDGLGSVLAVGVVSTRRTFEHTRQHMLKVAGPLLVMAAKELPLPPVPAQPPPAAVVASDGQRRAANAAGTARFVGRTATRATSALQWRIARLPGTTPLADLVAGRTITAPLSWLAPPAPNFWADPFILDGDPPLLFVEELEMTTGRGVIRVLEVSGTSVIPGPIVLRTDHHLSYPQVYRTPDGWLATVETCARHNPIYTFDEPGGPWRPTEHPRLPAHMGDPVLTFDDEGRLDGLLGTDAQTDPDSVVVRYELDPTSGRWLRDDASVRISVFNGRGGGTFDPVRRWRATQDCAGAYGRAVEVVSIHAGDGLESVVRIDADTFGPGTDGCRPSGVHTLTWTADGSHAWCDSWVRRPTALGWWWDIRERSHLGSCRG